MQRESRKLDADTRKQIREYARDEFERYEKNAEMKVNVGSVPVSVSLRDVQISSDAKCSLSQVGQPLSCFAGIGLSKAANFNS